MPWFVRFVIASVDLRRRFEAVKGSLPFLEDNVGVPTPCQASIRIYERVMSGRSMANPTIFLARFLRTFAFGLNMR